MLKTFKRLSMSKTNAAMPTKPLRVAIVGSGNWGSTAAKLAASNTSKSDLFETDVRMWVYEEMVNGRKLTDIINEDHENVKYLSGVKLPENVIAEPDLATAVKGADVLVFVVPHQFLPGVLPTIKKSMSPGAFGVSLIKGIDFHNNRIVLLSETISKELGIDMSVLMGANVADEIARGDFAEATIGGSKNSKALKSLFQTPYFRIATVGNAQAVELCGAIKNVTALGAGFCDGLGLGNNTKAAIIRIGLVEMARVIEMVTGNFPFEIIIESCGVADHITTCYGGRNRKCAEAFVKNPGQSWEDIERDLLNGQRLQGTGTCLELHKVLLASGKDMEANFPLFKNIYEISFEGKDPACIVQGLVDEDDMLDKMSSL